MRIGVLFTRVCRARAMPARGVLCAAACIGSSRFGGLLLHPLAHPMKVNTTKNRMTLHTT